MRDLFPVIQDLAALPEGAAHGEAPLDLDDVGEVLQRHGVTPAEFRILDDTPGRYGYNVCAPRGWHWKLRRWRNQPRTHPWGG